MNFSDIREKYDTAKQSMSLNHARMREDMQFSNPADPQQWPDDMLKRRKNRVSLVFDQTNQFINQVVNQYRQQRPQATAIPANSMADKPTAEALTGILRHIDYVSRANIAWDWAVHCAARIGVGWVRVYPQVVDAEYNTQEIRIARVIDPLLAFLDEGSTEPDGSDASDGYVLSQISESEFKRKYKKASLQSFGDSRTDGVISICEAFNRETVKRNRILIVDPNGVESSVSEDEYWSIAKDWGFQPQVKAQWMATEHKVKWRKLSGSDIIEETDFPSPYIPLVPVIGNELFVDGQRYLCGMTRRMMDSQRAYNYSRSADIETGALQPKAPFVGMQEAFAGYEQYWANANDESRAYLPFNGYTEINGQMMPIPNPQRQQPPTIGSGFGNLSMQAFNDLQSSVGMYQENLGAQTNANSGVAIKSRQKTGETATFHYQDNAALSREHMARIELSMIPKLYDTKRQARMLGVDNQSSVVTIDPEGRTRTEGKKAVVINPTIGAYDVQIKIGPSYGTLREETAQEISNMINVAPQTAAALLPIWAKMQDWPDSDKVAKVLLAMAPPEVQQAEAEGEESNIPPAIMQQMQQLQQQNQQMQQALAMAEQQVNTLKQSHDIKQQEIKLKAGELSLDERRVALDEHKVRIDATLRVAELQQSANNVLMDDLSIGASWPNQDDGEIQNV
jgi:hypothetical protein